METFSDSYELGFASEAGWKAMHPELDTPPPWDYVAELLHMRLENIKGMCNTDKAPKIYYTSGPTFRYDIAKRKPYKGTRKANKPWHYDNLTAYLKNVLGAEEVTGIEADDALSIKHCNSNLSTILCSRDKDLKQCPGYYYSWELGRQPSWGPALITKEGNLELSKDHKKLSGTGLTWFHAQCLIGDDTDNVPGLPNCGPVKAYELLKDSSLTEQFKTICNAYKEFYNQSWEQELLEQGQLVWLIRKIKDNGLPDMWELDSHLKNIAQDVNYGIQEQKNISIEQKIKNQESRLDVSLA